MPQKMTQGQRIRTMRLQKRYTQDYVAAQLGTTKQAIYKYEADIVKTIPAEKLLRLSQLFGCSPAWLQGLTEDPGTAPEGDFRPVEAKCGVPHAGKSDPALMDDAQFLFYRDFMDVMLRLTAEERRATMQFARFLLSQHEASGGEPDEP